jgi:hypothetical protein
MSVIFVIISIVSLFSIYDFMDSRNWQSATSSLRNKLIFENRNKRYGAYNIRTDYNNTLTFILIIFCISIFIIALLGFTFRTTAADIPVIYADTTLMSLEAPPLEEIETIETPYKVVGGGGGGSAGGKSQAPIDKTPEEQNKKQDTQNESNVSVRSGQSDNTNTDKSNKTNKATTIVKGKNPFGGGAAEKGTGSGLFGKDPGPGSGTGDGNGVNGRGTGTGGGGARKKLSSLNPDDIQSSEKCTIYVNVFINAEGTVIKAENVSSQTTTKNGKLISHLIDLIKRQIRYDARPNTSVQKQVLVISVQPN